MLPKVVQTFNSVDETLVYDQTNELLLNETLPTQPRFKSFQQKIGQIRALQKIAKFHTNPYNFVACLQTLYFR